MKKHIILILIVLFLAASCTRSPTNVQEDVDLAKEDTEQSIEERHWNRVFTKAFEPVDCPEPPIRNLPDSYYQGSMIDTHIHMQNLPDGEPGHPDAYYSGENLGIKRSMDEWECMLKYEGTSKAFAFFPVWDPITQESIDIVKLTLEKYPDRFVPFIMPPENDGSGYSTVEAEELSSMLEVSPNLFQGYGEIGLYDHEPGGPLPPDSERLMEIYPVLREHTLIVYFHLGEGQKEAFERALDANPDLTFIWHGDQLIDCGTCNNSLDDVEDILNKHPNVYYGIDELYGDVVLMRPDVTKEAFIAHFADYESLLEEDLATWKAFIERHPDRVLFGTDRGVSAPWDKDPEVALTINTYVRAFIGRLDPSVQEKFAYQNAERLLAEKSSSNKEE